MGPRRKYRGFVQRGWLRDRLLDGNLTELPRPIHRLRITVPPALSPCPYVDGVTYIRSRSELRFDFQFWMDDWKGDWTPADYVMCLRDVVRERADKRVRWAGTRDEFRDLYEGFSIAVGGLRRASTLREMVAELGVRVTELHEEAEESLRLATDEGAVVVRFEFPESVRGACEQYLVYFAEFLRDLGVGADTALTTEAGGVLFSVKPTDATQALSQIREALDMYLRLPASPISDVSFDDVAAQKLLANIRHLESQLALAQAVMYSQRASIQAQATTIENQQRIMSGDVVINSVAPSDREEFLGGTVALTRYEGKGFEVNLAEVMRRLRSLFRKK